MNKTIEQLAVENGFYLYESKNGQKLLIAHPDDEIHNGYYEVSEAIERTCKAYVKQELEKIEQVEQQHGIGVKDEI